jgi:hypothetical protein
MLLKIAEIHTNKQICHKITATAEAEGSIAASREIDDYHEP